MENWIEKGIKMGMDKLIKKCREIENGSRKKRKTTKGSGKLN